VGASLERRQNNMIQDIQKTYDGIEYTCFFKGDSIDDVTEITMVNDQTRQYFAKATIDHNCEHIEVKFFAEKAEDTHVTYVAYFDYFNKPLELCEWMGCVVID
jgi:hypothetical protein